MTRPTHHRHHHNHHHNNNNNNNKSHFNSAHAWKRASVPLQAPLGLKASAACPRPQQSPSGLGRECGVGSDARKEHPAQLLATHALNNLLAQHMLRGSALTSTSKIAPPVSPNAGFASAVGRLLVVAAASCMTVAPAPSRRAAVSRGTSRRGTPRANNGSGAVQCALCRAALPRNCARVAPNVKPVAGDRATTSSSAANAARGAVCGPMIL